MTQDSRRCPMAHMEDVGPLQADRQFAVAVGGVHGYAGERDLVGDARRTIALAVATFSSRAAQTAGMATHFAARSAATDAGRRSSSAEQPESGSSTRQRLSPRSSCRTTADRRQESFGESIRRETVSPLVNASSAKEEPPSSGALKNLQCPVAASGHDVPPNIALCRLSPVMWRSARKRRSAPPGLLHSPASSD